MGFGLLLMGYFTANMMALNSLGGVFSLVGYIIVLIAAKKLSQYNQSFFSLVICSIAMIALSAFGAFIDVSTFLYNYALIPMQIIGQYLSNIFSAVSLLFNLAFTAILCFSVKSIATETGATKIVIASIRNFIFFCLYFVLQMIVLVSYLSGNTALLGFVASTAIPLWMVLVNIICMVLICWMLFCCYSGICDSEDAQKTVEIPKLSFFKRKK